MASLNDDYKGKHNIARHILRLHKQNGQNNNAKAILGFVQRILTPASASQTVDQEAPSLNTSPNIYDSVPEFPDLRIIAGNVASEIACKIVNEDDTHNTTLSVLKILKQYSWETKVALSVATFVLTFGDSGLNMTANHVNKSPMFNEHEFKATSNLIKAMVETTNCIIDYEILPTTFFTSENPKIANASTDFLLAVYMVIRAVVAAAVDNITLSSKGVRYKTATSDPNELSNWTEKLKSISDDLRNMLPELRELLEVDIEIAVYNSIKDTVQREYHIDGMEVMNALISDNDMPLMYHGRVHKEVQLGVLQGKGVLLLIAHPDKTVSIIEIIDMLSEVYPYAKGYEIVWIPIIQQLQQQTVATEKYKFVKRKNQVPWYSVRKPGMIKKEVIKFFKDDWGYEVDPVVAVLDPQENYFTKMQWK